MADFRTELKYILQILDFIISLSYFAISAKVFPKN
jgi:hypothetical protein